MDDTKQRSNSETAPETSKDINNMRQLMADPNVHRILDAHPQLNKPPRRTGANYNATPALRILAPTVFHTFRNEILFILCTMEREFAGYIMAEQARRWTLGPPLIRVYERPTYRTKQRSYSVVSFDCASARLDYLETVDTPQAARKALRTWSRV